MIGRGPAWVEVVRDGGGGRRRGRPGGHRSIPRSSVGPGVRVLRGDRGGGADRAQGVALVGIVASGRSPLVTAAAAAAAALVVVAIGVRVVRGPDRVAVAVG